MSRLPATWELERAWAYLQADTALDLGDLLAHAELENQRGELLEAQGWRSWEKARKWAPRLLEAEEERAEPSVYGHEADLALLEVYFSTRGRLEAIADALTGPLHEHRELAERIAKKEKQGRAQPRKELVREWLRYHELPRGRAVDWGAASIPPDAYPEPPEEPTESAASPAPEDTPEPRDPEPETGLLARLSGLMPSRSSSSRDPLERRVLELERFAGWLVAELEEHEVEVPDEVAP